MEVVSFKNQIWDFIREVSEHMENTFRPFSEQHGLTMLQVRLLLSLQIDGPLTVGGLSKSMNIAGANASSMCKRLEQLGYLSRTRDTRDERVVQIVLTEQGNRILEEIQQAMCNYFEPVLKSISESELNAIQQGMRTLSRVLQQLEASLPTYKNPQDI